MSAKAPWRQTQGLSSHEGGLAVAVVVVVVVVVKSP